MTLRELALLVCDMRNAQKWYFRTKSKAALEASRALEKRVDNAVWDVMTQPGLFDRAEREEATHA